MKKAFLTVDIEEWYQLEYLDSAEEDRENVKMVPAVLNLLAILDEYDIKATFFVLADIAEQYYDILCEIRDKGHEIGCHGYDHRLLHGMSHKEFAEKAREAKRALEELLGEGIVKGYRASCFSMDRDKLDSLKEQGYLYDSSYIKFSEHPLYGEMDMQGFINEESLIYSKDGFFEFEIPTLKIMNHNIPISGGGYLRLFPLFLTKIFIKKFWGENSNILFYIHPFELTDRAIPFTSKTNLKNRFRASIGRNNNLLKLKKIIKWMKKSEVQFAKLSDSMKVNGQNYRLGCFQ